MKLLSYLIASIFVAFCRGLTAMFAWAWLAVPIFDVEVLTWTQAYAVVLLFQVAQGTSKADIVAIKQDGRHWQDQLSYGVTYSVSEFVVLTTFAFLLSFFV